MCVVSDGAKEKYGIKYGEPFGPAVKDNCKYGAGYIQLVNPDNEGKVAVLHTQGRSYGSFHGCVVGHYDKLLGSSKEKAVDFFNNRRAKLAAIIADCGKNKVTKVYNVNNKTSCLITTDALKKAGVQLPSADGEVALANGGVAISWGHGFGDGACGSMSLVQQGKGNGTEKNANPGNTNLHFQIGMRAWSGEINDTIDLSDISDPIQGNTGYLQDGASACLQPRFRQLSNPEIDSLLDTVCAEVSGCPTGTTSPKSTPKSAPDDKPKSTPKSAPDDKPKSTPKSAPDDKPDDKPDATGFTCKIPDVKSIRTGPDHTSTAAVCQKYKNANASDTRNVSWKEMAQAWKAAGNNMEYCPAALVIGGGECQPLADTTKGCNIQATGKSGIWQVDSARGGSLNLFNPCDNAKAVYDQIVRPPSSYDPGCFTGPDGSVTPSLRITGAPPGGGVGGADDKYFNTSGSPNCNWLGPFCHWQSTKTKLETCCAWTGGGNSNQPQGFPYYYQSKFLEYATGNKAPNCPGNCDKLAQEAYHLAKTYCDSV